MTTRTPRLIHCATLPRVQVYKLLGMAKSSAGISEQEYREILSRNGATADATGHTSAKTMSHAQLEAALHELQKRGGIVRRPAAKDWRRNRMAKCMALWHALANAGVVADSSHAALDAWVAGKVPGVTRLRWASSDQLNKAVEMLKRYAARNNVAVL